MQIQPPVSEAVDACLPQLTTQATAWYDLSFQLGVICLIIGFAIGMCAMYLRYTYGVKQ